jgi:hypothetical protein
LGALARWRSRARRLGEQWSTLRGEWQVERELEQVVGGDAPIVVGPWMSEVGYEVLYWAPFVRWVAAAYRLPPERLIVLSRGGTASWYGGLAGRYGEVFDYVSPEELATRAAAGTLKQREVSDLDRRVVEAASRSLGLGGNVRILHPSVMFRWFAPFWSGHETLGFVERHTRHTRVAAPDVPLPLSLPAEYVAVKLYGARSLPDGARVREQLRALVDGLSARSAVVHLDTGLGIDEHADYELGGPQALSVSGRLEPRTNLAVQTRIIAGARMFVGTCGSLAWLAPLLGVTTVPVFTDASFLHAHLHVARRAYSRLGAGSFAPLDISALPDAGLTIGRPDRLPVPGRAPREEGSRGQAVS